MVEIKKEKLIRAMIEGAVNLALKRAVSDPKRSIRNIIELAVNNSRGRFQRNFFDHAQRMLKNENSAYYTLVERAVKQIDHNILKKFGINLGYNGCTCGAEKIRQNEERMGINIPWAIYISTDGADEKFFATLKKTITEGMALGVYVYIVFGKDAVSCNLIDIYRQFDECAFIANCKAECVDKILLDNFIQINNVAFSVESNDMQQLDNACEILCRGKRLYGIHKYYGNEGTESLLTDEKLQHYTTTNALFVCFIPCKSCTNETKGYVKSRVLELRFGQMYPYFIIDFSADMNEIDHIISDDTCWVSILPDSTIYSCLGQYSGKEYDLATTPLSEILQRVTPPKRNNSQE